MQFVRIGNRKSYLSTGLLTDFNPPPDMWITSVDNSGLGTGVRIVDNPVDNFIRTCVRTAPVENRTGFLFLVFERVFDFRPPTDVERTLRPASQKTGQTFDYRPRADGQMTLRGDSPKTRLTLAPAEQSS